MKFVVAPRRGEDQLKSEEADETQENGRLEKQKVN